MLVTERQVRAQLDIRSGIAYNAMRAAMDRGDAVFNRRNASGGATLCAVGLYRDQECTCTADTGAAGPINMASGYGWWADAKQPD
jgi:hypothetical protein